MIFDNLYTVKSTAFIDRTLYDLNRINLISPNLNERNQSLDLKNMFWKIKDILLVY